MTKIAFCIACLWGFASVSLAAQTAKAAQLGVWQGTLDGLPGVTLTLADDTGEIGGSVVFYGIDGETRRIAVIEPHVLLRPKFEGNTLLFQMKFDRAQGGFATVRVVFTSDTKAQITCLDCGPDSPTAELVKQTN
jgi:hypothetical protein